VGLAQGGQGTGLAEPVAGLAVDLQGPPGVLDGLVAVRSLSTSVRHVSLGIAEAPPLGRWALLIHTCSGSRGGWGGLRTHRSVPQLKRSIQSWIYTWNQDPRPFVWTKTADEILDTIAAYCQLINDSGH
jgi:hypothetical protein